jgi:hypothetical protein
MTSTGMTLSGYRIKAICLILLLFFSSVQLAENLIFHEKIIPATIFVAIPAIYFIFVFVAISTAKKKLLNVTINSRLSIVLAFAIIGFPMISVIFQNIILEDQFDIYGKSALDYTRFIFTYGLTWFIIGLILGSFDKEINPLFPFMAAIFVLYAFYDNTSNWMLDYKLLREATGINQLSHLWLAQHVIIIFYLCYAVVRSLILRVIIFSVMVCVLFVAGGRSSLFLGIISVIFFELAINKGFSFRSRITLISVFLLGAVTFITYVLITVGIEQFEKRLVLHGLQADGSWQEREHALDVGLSHLHDQILIGDPTLIAEYLGSMGLYIHNLLSAWQFFGFPFFVASVLVFVVGFKKMYKLRMACFDSPMFTFKSLLLIYVATSMLITNFVGFNGFWLVMGLWLATPTRNVGLLNT